MIETTPLETDPVTKSNVTAKSKDVATTDNTEATSQITNKTDNSQDTLSFEIDQEFDTDKILSGTEFRKDTIIKGTIINISNDFVEVDINYKSMGRVPKEQFIDNKGNLLAEIGKEESFFLDYLEDVEGQVRLSKEKYTMLQVWDQVGDVFKNDKVLSGTIMEKSKGGMKVDIGVTAFLPNSQIDLKPIPDLEKLIGQNFDFKVLKYSKKKANIVLSRRALLELDRVEERKKTLKKIKKGSIVKGIVKNITDYGAFVDIGGIDGLLHITDIAWGRVTHPSEVCKIGDELEVSITDFDLEKNRVSLSIKDKQKDPWENLKYKIGDTVEGKVANIESYGVFVEIESGVEGLIHISEISWSKKDKSPSEVAKEVGATIKSVVKEIDTEKRRISLSIKELTPNPWKEVGKNLKEGSIVEGKIQNITDFGLFVTLSLGVDGLVHTSDIDWNTREEGLINLYEKGQKVQVKALSIDAENERLALGIKQMTPDPWKNAKKQSAGDIINGVISYIGHYGIFIKNEDGLEGLLHTNKLSVKLNSKDKLTNTYSIGDKITVKVLSIEEKSRRLAFVLPKSQKAKEYVKEQAELKNKIADKTDTEKATDDSQKAAEQSSDTEKTTADSQKAAKQSSDTEKTTADSQKAAEQSSDTEKAIDDSQKAAKQSSDTEKATDDSQKAAKQSSDTEKTTADSQKAAKQSSDTEKTTADSQKAAKQSSDTEKTTADSQKAAKQSSDTEKTDSELNQEVSDKND